MLTNGPVSFKMGLQSLTVQSTMEAELVAAVRTMNEAVFLLIIMVDPGFEKRFNSVPLYLENTSTLHVAGNRTYSRRVKHITLIYIAFKSC